MTGRTRIEPRWLSYRYLGERRMRGTVSEMTSCSMGASGIARLPASNCRSNNINVRETVASASIEKRLFLIQKRHSPRIKAVITTDHTHATGIDFCLEDRRG